jgi:ABC-2 type transport system ATP-binding protein
VKVNGTGARGATGAAASTVVRFDDVSKFYGEVLGVNRIDLEIGPGITSLVGPNGSGKTTLMNLATGLLRPTEGTVSVAGIEPGDPSATST